MSEENVALLRRAVEAYNRRDIPALLEELDPEVKWHPALPGYLDPAEALEDLKLAELEGGGPHRDQQAVWKPE